MIKGRVKWFDAKKGYGFITYHEDEDVFVHFTGILGDGFRTLKENQPVAFDIVEGRRGEQATNVEILDSDSESL
ncbi:cold-shock protein [Vagococcus lutrae]|uniref:cold-shock protein n=1 Tax=Vagococcus lutrae TaxID=81947 RepID=UPI001926CA7D|nr:cold-shock protein [Vagococcus lutrae]MDT2800968.1 cold-shock protein [Vagococcus lutrae]MDT2825138.1 cold-shock protein [Vagococcus lutrae]MDT2842285.1 cold-shock protein [Vagococcus lutrae]UQF38822.1 cold-shock protein [Vagococcus lutrae]GEQ61593.1 cold-shock protein [Vagococcus lutrae]